MRLLHYITRKLPVTAAAITLAAAVAGCQGAVFDGEGDCAANHYLQLSYTMNMKWADAFPAEVTHVGVYVFDTATGRPVWQGSESADRLRADGYRMALPLKPGMYDINVWCGGRSLEPDAHSWTLGATAPTCRSDLHCSLDAPVKGGVRQSTLDIHRLYHATLDSVTVSDTPGEHIHRADLTKSTNFIRVVLQHADGEPVDKDHFTFSIYDTNATLDHTNAPVAEQPVIYRPWAVLSAETAIPDPDATTAGKSREGITQVSSVVADMTTSRLVKGSSPTIEILCTEPGNEHTVARLDLISYFLMIKGSANRHVEDQEFLDRQDDYTMMLILDDNNRWNLKLGLYINSWRIVEQHTQLGD